MRGHPLGSLDTVLPLPDGPLPKASVAARLRAVKEAKGWPKGADKHHQSFERIYAIGGWELGLGKPGKEASRKTRPNEHDMTPTAWLDTEQVAEVPASFRAIWGMYESLARTGDRDVLEVCGRLLFRNAFLLDHESDSAGHLRYMPSSTAMGFLAGRTVAGTDMPLDVLHHFIELIALNEDVKYSTLDKPSGGHYELSTTGRPSNLLTAVHFILTLLGQSSIAELVASTSRRRGVSAITHVEARDRLLACSA